MGRQAVVGRDKGAASLKALPKEKGGLSSTKMKRNKNAEYAEGVKKKRGSSVWIVMDSTFKEWRRCWIRRWDDGAGSEGCCQQQKELLLL
jgi:hypothetical protein